LALPLGFSASYINVSRVSELVANEIPNFLLSVCKFLGSILESSNNYSVKALVNPNTLPGHNYKDKF